MSNISRLLIAIAAVALTATYFLPVWFIFLIAPQYPEGLTMNIWLNKITGQVEIINGLNHYIGMKHISAEMFPEFGYMIYIVGALIALGLVVALIGRRNFLLIYNLILIALGVAAMYDFYSWGYKYGHELDHTAAIQVPGLSYQPPVIGHKTLLNFDAYSYPDSGGWVVVVSAIIFFGVYFYEWRKDRRQKKAVVNKKNAATAMILASIVSGLTSCSVEPEPFLYGKDQCEECRMTIMDPRFASQIVTKKGRVFKFDDAHCLAAYERKNDPETFQHIVFNDFLNNDKFVDQKTAVFVQSPQLKSPMNGNAAAFSSRSGAEKTAAETNGELINWTTLKGRLK